VDFRSGQSGVLASDDGYLSACSCFGEKACPVVIAVIGIGVGIIVFVYFGWR
jgi:hypothetical protein